MRCVHESLLHVHAYSCYNYSAISCLYCLLILFKNFRRPLRETIYANKACMFTSHVHVYCMYIIDALFIFVTRFLNFENNITLI